MQLYCAVGFVHLSHAAGTANVALYTVQSAYAFE